MDGTRHLLLLLLLLNVMGMMFRKKLFFFLLFELELEKIDSWILAILSTICPLCVICLYFVNHQLLAVHV